MSTQQTPESGVRFGRVWVLREAVTGEIPADPDWQYYSDNLLNFSWAPSSGVSRHDGLGTPDPARWNKGSEEHDLTVAYDLQRPIVDANGDPDDFVGDAMLRNADNQLPNTHAIVAREERTTPSPNDPTNVQGARQYIVAKGGKADWNLEGDPEEGQPIPVELSYQFEKVRPYHVYQPAAATLLAVDSTDTDDSTQSLTIEGEDDTGTYTSETVALDGTTLVSTSTSFQSIDAVELDAETNGDVTVYINDGDGTAPAAGSALTTLYGALEYSNDDQPLEGDLGIPALGAGSAATEIGTTYEHFIGDSVQRNAEDIAFDLNNFVAEGSNGINPTSRSDSVRMRLTEGNRETTQTADVIGERESHDYIMQSLRNVGADIVWTLSNTRLTFPNATIPDGNEPERTRESDEAAASISVGFESDGIQVEAV